MVTATVAAGTVLLSSCGALRLEQLPAPQGISGPTYRVTAEFRDVIDLTIGAKVKLGGVVVGDVASISTKDYHALVGMDIERKFPLPVGTTFQIRFTTPLGDDFVAAAQPSNPAGSATLADGAHVPLAQTNEAATIEDTFAALSLLLNGGGLDKVRVIAAELDKALTGRTNDARDTIAQLHKVVTNLDAHKNDIDRALDSLARVSKTLDEGGPLIEQALGQFPATIQLLANDTDRIRTLVQKVAALGDVVTAALQRGEAAMLADFDKLRPTLDALRASEANLIPTFQSLDRFASLFDRATPGDYINLSATIDFLFDAPVQRPSVSTAGAQPSDAITGLLTGGLR